jgi:hypothetical protein
VTFLDDQNMLWTMFSKHWTGSVEVIGGLRGLEKVTVQLCKGRHQARLLTASKSGSV